MRHLSTIAMLLFAIPLAYADDKAQTSKLSDADIQVVAILHHANQSEIEMAADALTQGTKRVTAYATDIVKDHFANDSELITLANRHGLAKIPAPYATDDTADLQKLKAASGPQLDRLFIDLMAADHAKDIRDLSDGIAAVSDADLRAFLTATRPVMKRHLANAKNLQGSPQASN